MGRDRSRAFHAIIGGLFLGSALLLLSLLNSASVHAEPPAPVPDAACIGCHQDTERTLILPSGEELPLRVIPAELEASPHSWIGEAGMRCTSCHIAANHFRYPHPPTPAQTLQEYRETAAQRCLDCHVYHNPLHRNAETEDPVAAFAAAGQPNCVDCHGSHGVSWIDDGLAQSMAPNCLACHTGQESHWAEALLAPRPGLGEGAGGYVGSRTCLGCHTDNYMGWEKTLHANTIQSVALSPDAILADFERPGVVLPFQREDVTYVIGQKWQQRFITAVEGELWALPAQWNVATEEWVFDIGGEMVNWRTECSYCHVAGLDTETWTFTEFGVGCESCHGPGEAHANAPQDFSVLTQPDDQVCGACHSRGASPEGHPFPATYRPGDTLTDHFTFTTDETTRWPDGSAKAHNQQYTDWIQSDKINASDELGCTTCHEVHKSGLGPSQTILPTAQMCTACHADKTALARHIPYHQQVMTRRDFACTDCHMPLMAVSAVAYDIHSHTFKQPDPHGSLAHGGLEFMPNACNQCHTNPDQGPAWAADTIDWAIANYSIVRTGYVFGPGPTPAAAPVPTPLPSVGEAFEVSAYIDFAWVRPAFFGGLGLLGLIGLLLFIRWFRTRRYA